MNMKSAERSQEKFLILSQSIVSGGTMCCSKGDREAEHQEGMEQEEAKGTRCVR